jgi:hypothetical protein
MGLFRKTNKMLEPLIPANTPVAHKVMETLRSLEGRIYSKNFIVLIIAILAKSAALGSDYIYVVD